MIVLNLYHIKNKNGLFYYGKDYIADIKCSETVVLARRSLYKKIRNDFNGIKIIPCGFLSYIFYIIYLHYCNFLIFTPSAHPLPFLNKQIIVFHDEFPFVVGRLAALKRLLFKLSISFSKCNIFYINNSSALPYLRGLGIPSERLVFAPNKFPCGCSDVIGNRKKNNILSVGLMGTDSEKKNYDKLFFEYKSKSTFRKIIFMIYGHENDYFKWIISTFPEFDIRLVSSDEVSLCDFISIVDLIVSVSENEGFGRPIATALTSAVPVLLLNSPVFREFFEGGAEFYPRIESIVNALVEVRSSRRAAIFVPSSHIIDGYNGAVLFVSELINI